MDSLPPNDAAHIAGVPPQQLIRWAWDDWDVGRRRARGQVGPRNCGTRHKPLWKREDVLAWRGRYEGGNDARVGVSAR